MNSFGKSENHRTMFSFGIIGEIKEIGKGDNGFSTFEWKIPHFPHLSNEDSRCYFSPEFTFCNEKWEFKIYPNGINQSVPVRYMEISLIRYGKGPPQTFALTLGIKGPEEVEYQKERMLTFSNIDDTCCWKRFFRRSMLNRNARLLSDNTLTLSCEIKNVVPTVTKAGEKALDDFGKLLSSGENSDVTVQVGDAEIKAHRSILSVRSPALAISLQHDSKEKASNRIIITDCSADVFREYLQYVYTGSVHSLTKQNVFDIYRIADKYLANDLKEQCINYIRDTLCIRTICETIKLAMLHSDNSLLDMATNFTKENFHSLVCCEDWQNFNCEYPRHVNEILIKCFGF